MKHQPWMKFYPADWRSDPCLRMCSIGARGLWMEMLCIMHEADPRGSLLINGQPINDKHLSSLTGVPHKEILSLVAELETAGVFSRENGIIFSRRMRNDEQKSQQGKAFGALGGNPILNGGGKRWNGQ